MTLDPNDQTRTPSGHGPVKRRVSDPEPEQEEPCRRRAHGGALGAHVRTFAARKLAFAAPRLAFAAFLLLLAPSWALAAQATGLKEPASAGAGKDGSAATEDLPLPEISERALHAHVAFLAHRELEGRAAGSHFERIAAAYVAAHLDAAGIPPPPGAERLQRFPLPTAGGVKPQVGLGPQASFGPQAGLKPHAGLKPEIGMKSQVALKPQESLNVLGFVEGTDPALAGEVIVLGAHLDHLGNRGKSWFPGADDNASGVAAALEIAVALAEHRQLLGRSVLLAFFGAEEPGRVGSQFLVAHPPVPLERVAAMINVDMIGRRLVDQKALAPLKSLLRFDDRRALGVVGALERPAFAKVVEAACARTGVTPFGTKRIPLLSGLVEKLAQDRGDNAPFEAAGIPTLFFGSGESDDYHRPTDTLEKIEPDLMALRARAIFTTAVLLSRLPSAELPRKEPPRGEPAPDGPCRTGLPTVETPAGGAPTTNGSAGKAPRTDASPGDGPANNVGGSGPPSGDVPRSDAPPEDPSRPKASQVQRNNSARSEHVQRAEHGELPDHPNIVLILADDLGWAELGCYQNQFNETPHLDRLSARGARFTSAYATAPVCSPTRAALLAGQWPARVGITDYLRPDDSRRLSTNHVTLAEALKAAGYATGIVGKWHLSGYARDGADESPPGHHGFDEVLVSENRGIGGGSYFHPYHFNREIARKLPDPEYLVDRLSLESVEFIERHRAEPFFLYLSHYAVHTALVGKPEAVARYEAKPGAGKGPSARRSNPHLAAQLEAIDEGIGKIVAKIDELGLAEQTIVVFTSDNGGEDRVTVNGPLRAGKSTLYEGGIRVPLIVSWPGRVKAGGICDAPVTTVDLYPTLLEMARVAPSPAQRLDGVSLAPLLEDPTARLGRDAIYWHYPLGAPHFLGGRSAGAIRAGSWKLIEFFDTGAVELYDLAGDPGEARDLAAARPEKAGELRRALAAWRAELGAGVGPGGSAGRPGGRPGCYHGGRLEGQFRDTVAAEMRGTPKGLPACPARPERSPTAQPSSLAGPRSSFRPEDGALSAIQ